ncbi:hypothetical protein A3G06_01605 [Candidatus Nomurabacteria bacterium RIFCSPLOWO2_12_FULL_46_14]|uniref:dUTP diphosphatase n=1 Tax=Candidatus Nomurabacteria bacterium RIFCSPLOWO2_12_FULL_46_14 TaxID=1801797 RepID=A0A1F6Y9J1_9BACT|nr:MAG: hypothetical protein A3G06_01605 [Candidatus Nomurabacteria bacterium RIFCSPLOWO2_12_FULL_46_14]
MQIKVKKLRPDAKLPTHGHPGDAGVDFYTLEEVIFPPGAQRRIHTGIALEVPEGHVGLCWDKSGPAFNKGLKLMGGVIDAGFRGELVGSMVNLSGQTQVLEKGHKCFQMLIQKFEHCDIVEVSEISETVRGHGREGSTGHK